MTNALKKLISENRIIIITIFIIILMAFIYPIFLSKENIYGLFMQMPAYGFAALGLTWCFLCHELDVSMGSVMAVSAVMFAVVAPTHGFILGLLTAISMGFLSGSVIGISVSFFKLDSFIVSLAMLLVGRGTALVISHEMPVLCIEPVTQYLFDAKLIGIPLLFWIFVVFVIINELIMRYTIFGRNVFIVGGDKEVADYAGINIRFYKYIVFVLTAVFSSLGAIVAVCRQQSGSPILAEGAPLTVIPMVIVGGTAMAGGKGGAVKTLFGVIFMGLIFNIMALFGVYINIQSFVKGAILLSVVVFDNYMNNKDRKI